jgi:tRNA threonylcarbamoyladenosine biosynthesis protein TsaE
MSMVSPLMKTNTHSAAETKKLGYDLGQLLKRGLVLALAGDLGSGKTVFVKGLAKGLGVPEDHYVVSPTYTLINEYTGRMMLFHADLYRLSESFETADIGLDEIIDRGTAGVYVVAIEWADRIESDEFSDHLAIDFDISGDTTRSITFRAQGLEPSRLLARLAEAKPAL